MYQVFLWSVFAFLKLIMRLEYVYIYWLCFLSIMDLCNKARNIHATLNTFKINAKNYVLYQLMKITIYFYYFSLVIGVQSLLCSLLCHLMYQGYEDEVVKYQRKYEIKQSFVFPILFTNTK